jgi:hypothetical protein
MESFLVLNDAHYRNHSVSMFILPGLDMRAVAVT